MEMVMWNSTVTRVDLHASIIRLQNLDRVPGRPRDDPLGPAPATELSRFLSRERECEIASNLSFISATSDSHLKVMAVYVEEDSKGQGITLRLAPKGGDLTVLTSGLEGLARTLERAACRS
jgi:hypothetical protein